MGNPAEVTTPIDIKVNLDGDLVDAQARLGCTNAAAVGRDVWFAEPRLPGAGGPPTLLADRIAIRLRSGDHDDVTVTLRPCLPAQLVGRWAAPFTDEGVRYRIAGDWCGGRRELSAAVRSNRPPGTLRVAALRGEDLTEVLDSAQRQFLVSCTPPGVAVDHLRAVGPVAATAWTGVVLGDFTVDAERWAFGGLDLFDLSLTVAPAPGESAEALRARALVTQQRLHDAVRAHGLAVATELTKTEQVLTASAMAGPAWSE